MVSYKYDEQVSSPDEVETVILSQVKESLDKTIRSSITRWTAFSKSVRLPALDRLRLYFKIGRVKLCQEPNVSFDEKPAPG